MQQSDKRLGMKLPMQSALSGETGSTEEAGGIWMEQRKSVALLLIQSVSQLRLNHRVLRLNLLRR